MTTIYPQAAPSMLARARAGLNLTPGERALLRLGELCVIAGLVSALPIVAEALAQQPINWTLTLQTAISAFGVAALGCLVKWLKAQADAPLAPAAAPQDRWLNDTGPQRAVNVKTQQPPKVESVPVRDNQVSEANHEAAATAQG